MTLARAQSPVNLVNGPSKTLGLAKFQLNFMGLAVSFSVVNYNPHSQFLYEAVSKASRQLELSDSSSVKRLQGNAKLNPLTRNYQQVIGRTVIAFIDRFSDLRPHTGVYDNSLLCNSSVQAHSHSFQLNLGLKFLESDILLSKYFEVSILQSKKSQCFRLTKKNARLGIMQLQIHNLPTHFLCLSVCLSVYLFVFLSDLQE